MLLRRSLVAVALVALLASLMIWWVRVSEAQVALPQLRARLEGAFEGDVRMVVQSNRDAAFCFTAVLGPQVETGDTIEGSIHRGRPGSNGPLVVDLKQTQYTEGVAGDCGIAPLAMGRTIAANPEQYYVELRVITSPDDGLLPPGVAEGPLERDTSTEPAA